MDKVDHVKIARLESQLQALVDDMLPSVVELAEFSGADQPERMADNPEALLPLLDAFWMWEDIAGAEKYQREWFQARLIAFIGLLCIRRYGGEWYVQSNADKEFYAQYVIGRFTRVNKRLELSAYALSENIVNSPPGRSLIGFFEDLDDLMTKEY